LAQLLNDLEQVGEGAGEAIDPHHHQGVALANPLEAAQELDAATAAAAAGGALIENDNGTSTLIGPGGRISAAQTPR
jgi:hypothetical protein